MFFPKQDRLAAFNEIGGQIFQASSFDFALLDEDNPYRKRIKKMSEIDFEQSSGIRPTFLGRRFRLGDDPEIYRVMGLIGRENRVLLQAVSTEEVREMPMHEFQQLATRADE